MIGKFWFLNDDVNNKVLLFNETILNITRNFIPHEIVTRRSCDDRNLPWMTRLIKEAIKNKDIFYQRFVKNKGFTNNLDRFRSLQNNLKNTIKTTKQQCFAKISKKLSDPNINSKTYWYILKCFNWQESSFILAYFWQKQIYYRFKRIGWVT